MACPMIAYSCIGYFCSRNICAFVLAHRTHRWNIPSLDRSVHLKESINYVYSEQICSSDIFNPAPLPTSQRLM